MVDFRNNQAYKAKVEDNIYKKINYYYDKLDALEIIKALTFRETEKSASYTINMLNSERVFMQLSGFLPTSVEEEKVNYIFEGPSQKNFNFYVLLKDNRVLLLSLMRIYDKSVYTYVFKTQFVERSLISDESKLCTVDSLSEIIKYYSELYHVRPDIYKGKSRTRS